MSLQGKLAEIGLKITRLGEVWVYYEGISILLKVKLLRKSSANNKLEETGPLRYN